MDAETYQVYVKVEYPDRIVAVDSSAFLTSTRHWTLIDEGTGDRYRLAKEQYFAKPVLADCGVSNYKLVDAVFSKERPISGRAIDRTELEIANDLQVLDVSTDVDYDLTLATSIKNAQTLDELKDALLGKYGIAKVKAERK